MTSLSSVSSRGLGKSPDIAAARRIGTVRPSLSGNGLSMLEELDVYRAARLLIEKHGADAEAYAMAWGRALRETGNTRDAVLLERIVAAIDHLMRVGMTVRKPARGSARRRKSRRAKVVRINRH
jgi:hypothetical protein